MAVTAGAPRAQQWHAVEVSRIRALTPTVRLLRLRPLGPSEGAAAALCAEGLQDLDFSPLDSRLGFQAGQWIDCAIPGVREVGGYSLVSDPALAATHVDIAVKRARHPPAAWLHSPAATPGSLLAVRVGGAFTLAALPRPYPHLLLLAGGVGINPLYCMLLELAGAPPQPHPLPHRIDLVYCVREAEEVLFATELRALEGGALAGRLRVHLLVTAPAPAPAHAAAVMASTREARAALVTGLARSAAPGGVGVLLCGPPNFSDSMGAVLAAAGVPAGDVHCEKWW